MGQWVNCPQCGLKHSLRPDGCCPRCHTLVGEAPSTTPAVPHAPLAASPPPLPVAAARGQRPSIAAPAALPDVYDGSVPPAALPRGKPATDDSSVPLGARIAGVLLVLNAVAVVLERVLEKSSGVMPGGPGPALLDIALGIAVVAGSAKALTWTRIRVVLGLVALPIIFIVQGEVLQAVLQIFFSVGLLLLLLGRAGVPRMVLGGATVGLFLALEGVGLLGMTLGQDFLTGFMMAGQLESGVVTEIQGVGSRYRLPLTGEGWRLRRQELARKDNALADRWAFWPAKAAHVMVIAETITPGVMVDMDRLQEAVLSNAREVDPGMTVVSQSDERTSDHRVRVVQARAVSQGNKLRFVYGLHIAEPRIFQVVTFIPEENADETTLTLLRQNAAALEPL